MIHCEGKGAHYGPYNVYPTSSMGADAISDKECIPAHGPASQADF